MILFSYDEGYFLGLKSLLLDGPTSSGSWLGDEEPDNKKTGDWGSCYGHIISESEVSFKADRALVVI